MPEPSRVVIDRVDWKRVLPVLRLSSAFKHALQPSKLIVALIAVLAIHFSGVAFDAVLGINESNDASDDFTAYEALVQYEASAIDSLMSSALSFEHGFGPSSRGVADSLFSMFVGIPGYMFENHPWFTLLFGIDVLFILMMTSGILTRMSATQVCANRLTGLGDAAGFVSKHWTWYLITPLMPVAVIVVVGALLALLGLALFNVPWLDIVGALGYGLFLVLGFVIAIVSLLLLLALFLIPAALSVEGSDGFDAIARSFNYILFRPWQFGIYLLASAFYLAAVFVVVGGVAGVTQGATNYFIGLGVIGEPEATDASIWIMTRWGELVTAIVAAIMLSTLCCLQTQVYVLMRRSADGTPMDQCECGEPVQLWADASTELSSDAADDKADETDATKAEG
ncbi:MAG: hypothetical protein AB8C95_10815 [Phycisphaeraceae bacterium]